jgi:hypothetical protein
MSVRTTTGLNCPARASGRESYQGALHAYTAMPATRGLWWRRRSPTARLRPWPIALKAYMNLSAATRAMQTGFQAFRGGQGAAGHAASRAMWRRSALRRRRWPRRGRSWRRRHRQSRATSLALQTGQLMDFPVPAIPACCATDRSRPAHWSEDMPDHHADPGMHALAWKRRALRPGRGGRAARLELEPALAGPARVAHVLEMQDRARRRRRLDARRSPRLDRGELLRRSQLLAPRASPPGPWRGGRSAAAVRTGRSTASCSDMPFDMDRVAAALLWRAGLLGVEAAAGGRLLAESTPPSRAACTRSTTPTR